MSQLISLMSLVHHYTVFYFVSTCLCFPVAVSLPDQLFRGDKPSCRGHEKMKCYDNLQIFFIQIHHKFLYL